MEQLHLPGKYDFIDSETMKEQRLRSTGAWCHKSGMKGAEHYYVAKNAKSELAISLCAIVIAPMSKLQVTQPDHKCLVCALYSASREEQQDHHIGLVSQIAQNHETTPKQEE